MSSNLKCPKGYGEITFIIATTHTAYRVWCPVSGKADCVECDVERFQQIGNQVKRKEQ